MDSGLVAALSELAARVQRGRTTDDVLRIAGDGVERLGIRLVAFQIDGDDLALRFLVTSRERYEAIERMVGQPLLGLRAPLARCTRVMEIVARRENVYRHDHELFVRFIDAATGRDPLPLDAKPATCGISNGIVAPLFVRGEPWGVLLLLSDGFRPEDAPAAALFATHLGSAIEVAEYIEELRRTQDELIARDRLATIGELAATVAHEVRNPLGVLFNTFSSLRRLMSEEIGPSTSRYQPSRRMDAEVLLSIASEETERLNAIVSDLLEFARPRAMRTKATVLASVVRDVASALPQLPGAFGNVELRLDLCPDIDAIEVDARLVRQALLNLVLNAVQAMPAGGTVIVRTYIQRRADASFACVDVVDTGLGIAAEDQQRILEPFYTTKATGTGPGLPLVKRVIEAHQGELSIASGDAGTTFTVRLPMAAALAPETGSSIRLRRGALDGGAPTRAAAADRSPATGTA